MPRISLARTGVIFAEELSRTFRRPLFWFLIGLLAFMSWGLASGNMTISSGDSSVGGVKAWVTSEFAFARGLMLLIVLVYGFFGSIAAGMAVISDDEARVSDLLLSTPLRPSEYIWGKFLGILGGFLAAFGIHLLLAVFFGHVLPNPEGAEIRGPFEAANYLRPALAFGLPALIFYTGVSFFVGERWRRPVTVFLFPIAVLVLCNSFLWTWTPPWLDLRINRLLMLAEPSGFRWINETWIKLDRGAGFYNTARVGIDLPFLLSRLAFLGLGLLGVVLAQRHLAAHLQGAASGEGGLRFRRSAVNTGTGGAVAPLPRSLADLRMGTEGVGFLRGTLEVAGTELRSLLASPGLYLFGVLIVILTISNSLLAVGRFGEELLLTPGKLADQTMEILALMTCLLMMFYTAESIERERITGLAPISFSTPSRTASFLFGKALGNCGAVLVLAGATFLGCVAALLVKSEVPFDVTPFLILWGALLIPTFLVWICFILAVQAVGGQRYLTYGVGLGVMGLSAYFMAEGKMTWVGNWWLLDTIYWSDMGTFGLDGQALLLNRLFYLGLAAFFTVVAIRAFGRREADAIAILHRREGPRLWRSALTLAPWVAVPLVLGIALWNAVDKGGEGGDVQKKGRDYWKQNFATWRDAPQPSIAGVDLDLEIDPEERWLKSRGSYELINGEEKPLNRFALTGTPRWEKLRWTFNGKAYEPENRSGLYVFTPPAPLPPGGRVRIGWELERHNKGVTRNGGGANQFILPSGVVLNSFTPSFVPVVGYDEGVGIKRGENDYEPRDYEEGFYEGRTEPSFGSGRPYPTRISITGPSEYTFNSVGTKVSETEKGGRRTVVWKSDHPVRFFNVVGGRWDVRRGQGTAVYYHPGHSYNIDAMVAALTAARRYYSEWFHPFPWRELKLSEFPDLASYAQGFPTDITFSEGIGFLTKSDEKTDAVFLVTAHETAHQWWGNLLTPGKGPGANLLSEGMSHYSTALLFNQVKGPNARMEFMKRIEEQYGDRRRADAERPLVKIDGSREGDTTVTYDKGGWVFWMMDRHLGRERMLAGLQKLIADWGAGPDYPVLQDFTAAMRPFAADPVAYDAFVQQWFHRVVVPEYRLSDARLTGSRPWKVAVKVKNAGTGRMPVEVAAVSGERFPEEGKPKAGYKDARRTVVLGAGEERTVEISCSFRPERVVVDPDIQVLQLRRKAAAVKL